MQGTVLELSARGGRIAAGGGLFAGGPFAAGLIAGGLFASGLNAATRTSQASEFNISDLSIIRNNTERLLVGVLIKHNLINLSQHGFLKSRS